jgi:hypothetical protein
VALAALAVLAAGLALPAGRLTAAAPAGLALLLVADLYGAARNVLRTPWDAPGRALLGRSAPALASLVRDQPLARVVVLGGGFDPDLSPKGAATAGVLRLDDYDPLSTRRHAEFLDPPRPGRVAPRVARRFAGHAGAVPRRLLDLSGTRFVVVAAPALAAHELAPMLQGMRPRGPLDGARGTTVWENPDALPRAFVAGRWRVVPDRDEVLAALAQPELPLATTVLLESPPPLAPDPSVEANAGTARIVAYTPEDVRIEATAAGPSLLVLTDTFAPGWEATVDGVPVPILRADFLFRAVPLGAGTHRVRFTYCPRSFRLGAAISGGALLALGLLGVVAVRRSGAHSR